MKSWYPVSMFSETSTNVNSPPSLDSSQLFDCSVTIQSRERGEWLMPFFRAPSWLQSWCSIFLIVKVTNSGGDNLPHILFTESSRLKRGRRREVFTQLWACKGWPKRQNGFRISTMHIQFDRWYWCLRNSIWNTLSFQCKIQLDHPVTPPTPNLL